MNIQDQNLYKEKFIKYLGFMGAAVAILAYPLDIKALYGNLELLLTLRGEMLFVQLVTLYLVYFKKSILHKYYNIIIVTMSINIALIVGLIEGYHGNIEYNYYFGVLQAQIAGAGISRLRKRESMIIIVMTFLAYLIPTAFIFQIELSNIAVSMLIFSILFFFVASSTNYYMKSLEQTTEAQLKILSIVTHEINNPLQYIYTATEMLKQKVTDESQLKLLNLLEKSSKNVALLVKDILDSSRIGLGFLKTNLEETTPIMQSLEDAIEVATRNKSKNIRVTSTFETKNIQIQGEAIRVEQVFVNLLSNAIKYGATNDVGVEIARDEKFTHVVILNECNVSLNTQSMGVKMLLHAQALPESNGLGFWISKNILQTLGGVLTINQQGSEIKVTASFLNVV